MGRPESNQFYIHTRERFLEPRLEQARRGETLEFTDLRNLFYQVRKSYLGSTGLKEIDWNNIGKVKPYDAWITSCVNAWCKNQAKKSYGDTDRWMDIRDSINVEAHGRAICYPVYGREYLVNRSNRGLVGNKCLLIFLCEKLKVGLSIHRELTGLGYPIEFISTGGKNTGDVQQALWSIFGDNPPDNFFILSLHDYDLDGATIYCHQLRLAKSVIDIGINEDFIKYTDVDRSKVDESVVNDGDTPKLRESIRENGLAQFYDMSYLETRRIEIDSVDVEYGIKPFIDYILHRLEDISCWNLKRIGLGEQELYEPRNIYADVITEFEKDVGSSYGYKLHELSSTFREIHAVINDTLTLDYEFVELQKKYLGDKIEDWQTDTVGWEQRKVKGTEKLEEEHKKRIAKQWKPGYQEELDEINKSLECYPGDPTTAKENIHDAVEELQGRLTEAKANDPNLEKFKEELEAVEWGEEELSLIEAPNPVEEIRKVIDALEELIREKEAF